MKKPTKKQEIGKIGEDLAVRFLVKHGYTIVSRNYLKKYGEIDIICRKNTKLHFVEVKTVSRVTHEDSSLDQHRPEDNVHPAKLARIGRTLQAYVFEHEIDNNWQFDVITVKLSKDSKTAIIEVISDLVL